MRYREHHVAPPLRPYVDAIWTLSSGAAPAPPEAGTVVPDGCTEIVISRADPIRARRWRSPAARLLVGQMEQPWRMDYAGAVDLIGVRLHPAAASAFLRCSASATTNRVRPLGVVAPELDRSLAAVGATAESLRDDIRQVTRVLDGHAAGAGAPHPLVQAATSMIRLQGGMTRIDALANALGATRRQLERAFASVVGLSPKRWSRIVRFQHALDAASNGAGGTWADIAARLGYADQPHLVREFAEFCGVSPAAAWRSHRRISSRRRPAVDVS